MPNANLLFANRFDGDGYPTFDPWPNFTRPTGNPSLASVPVVDGNGWGIASRHHAVRWRLKETRQPGRGDYKADLHAKWKNPGGQGDRSVGLIVRFKDFNNFIVARLSSKIGGASELTLWKVINGTETQLGSTYSGAGVSASKLYAGISWRVRVEDLQDGSGDTSIKVFTDPLGASGDGDLRIDWTGTPPLRGNYTVGVELGSLVKLTDVKVDNLEVYDFADEWTSAAPSEPGAGWQVELDGVLYDVNDDTGQLEARDLPVTLMGCGQALGLSGGQEAKFRLTGEFQEGTFLRANQEVRVYHDGDIRLNGYMSKGRMLAQPQETQEWIAKDSSWRATYVNLEEDDCSGTLFFNVYDEDSDDYDGDRQDMTIGEIIVFLFDRYVDSNEGLRFYGAAPVDGLPYVQSELNLLDAVVPDISVSGTFLNAIQTLLKWMPTYQIWVNPEDKVWHFRDVTAATGENIALTSEWARLSIQPDPERAATAICWRGAKKEQDAGLTLTNADAAWTDGQAATYTKNKRHRKRISLKVLFAGDSPSPPSVPGQPGYQGKPGLSLVYVDVPPGSIDDDDFRGAVAAVSGDAYLRWVVSHTSTRIWLSSPGWGGGSPPAPGGSITMTLVHPDAVAALSANGVGRAFFYPIAELCPGPNPYKANVKNGGWCGNAKVSADGEDGSTSTQDYSYKLHMMSIEQSNAFGQCGVVELSEKPKPPISLINFALPGKSPPIPECEAGGAVIPKVQIEIDLPTTEDCAPKFRIPEEEETFEGDAYEEWGVRRTVVIDDPDFVHTDQEPGLKKAAQNTLDLFSQKIYLWDVTLATPWQESGVTPGFRPPPTTTSRWAGLTKRITLSSTKRTTGYESIDNLPVFSVWWDVPGNTTTLQAGTAAGWIGGDFGSIARTLVNKNEQKRILKMLKEVEDFRNRLIQKAADRVQGMQAGPIDGCDVTVIDQNTKKVTNINIKAEQEQEVMNHQGLAALAADTLFNGVEQDFPGAQSDVPGLDGAEAQQAIDGPVLRSYADHRIPFMGPTGATNSDRSAYGGLIGVDDFDTGGAPEIIFKRGGFAFRKKPNSSGSQGGGVGLQFSPLDTDGSPTTWTDYSSPLDLPNGKAPLSMLGHGSTQHQLLERSRELARALGRVENDVGELLAPGDADAATGIEAAPADLASMFRASGLLGGDLRVVPESFGDPGGVVYEGPISDSGATADRFWRVMTPEMLLVRVTETPGAGLNEGNWSWYGASGDSYEYMSSGKIVHKQAHPVEFEPVCGMSAEPHPASGSDSTHPFGITGNALAFDTSTDSAVAVNIPIPDGAVGTPVFSVQVKEDWDNPLGGGQTYDFDFSYSYQASAWTAGSSPTSHTGVVTGDGSGTGTGQFLQPGGAVPPGLRAVSGAVISSGTGTGGFGGIVTGINVDIAVVEGGYLARIKEDPIGVADELVHSHPASVETVSLGDSFVLDFTKVIGESLGIGDDWSLELNPPVEGDELVTISDSWVTELNP